MNPLASFEDLESYFFDNASTAALAMASRLPATVSTFAVLSNFFPIVHTVFSDTYCDVILDNNEISCDYSSLSLSEGSRLESSSTCFCSLFTALSISL